MPGYLHAAGNCSPYMGQASLNEFFKDKANQGYDADDFVEVKILNGTITSSIFDTWSIRICEQNDAGNNNDADNCSSLPAAPPIFLSSFGDRDPPWLVLQGDIGRYVNFKTGFDAILFDGNDDVIDYVTVDGYKPQEEPGCNGSTVPKLPFDFTASSPGASDKFIFRIPDGTGDWGSAPSASAPPSEDDTNDTAPDGSKLPTITVTDVTVNKGQTATFTFTLTTDPSGGTVKYPITINYKTTGGNAVSNTTDPVNYDYTEVINTSNTTIFPVGAADGSTSTVTVNVNTNASTPSTPNTVYFYLLLFGQTNATVINSYPIGTILGNATAEWYMDESAWTDTANEVSDVSSNANHGTPQGGASTSSTEKILCSSGFFDGTNGYIRIPDSDTIEGLNQLTYSVWVKPTAAFSSTSITQIMSKSDLDGGAGAEQMGIFVENDKLVGRAITATGVKEVYSTPPFYSPLPALNRWTHITLVFNGNALTLYKNGVIAPDFSPTFPSFKFFPSTTLIDNTNPLIIGRHKSDNKYFFKGYIDEAVVMQSSLPAGFIKTMYDNYIAGKNWNGAARSCPSSLHHFEIRHDAVGLTCEPENIYVKACADVNCSSLYSSDITVTPSPASAGATSWQPAPQIILANTETTLQLSHKALSPSGATSQTLLLDISSTTPAPTDSNVVCKDLAGNLSSCNIAFYDSGFTYTIPTQISCETSTTPITIKAVRKDDTTQQCVDLFTGSVSKTIDFTISAAPSPDIVMNKGDANEETFTSAASTQSVDLSFDNSEATFTLTHDNAGQFILTASHVNAGLTMLGSSSFVVRPYSYFLEAAYDNAGTEVPLNNATSTNNPKWKASDNFRLRLRGQCQIGTVTTNYVPTNAEMQVELNLPDGGENNNFTLQATDYPSTASSTPTWYNISSKYYEGAVSNVVSPASTNTTSYADAAFHEVGVLNLHIRDINYFGATIPEQTLSIGRFTPHHFDTSLIHGCTGGSNFTYSGQPFSVTATARNNNGATPEITKNYHGLFSKDTVFSNAGVTTNFTTNTLSGGVSGDFINGIGNNTNVTYTFPSKETPPIILTLHSIDLDNASSTGYIEETTEIRSGRMRLENAFGSELTPLTLPLLIEFYSDNTLVADTSDDGFILNTDDSCSTYDAVGGTLVNFTGNLTIADVAVTGSGTVVQGNGSIIFHQPGDVTLGPGAGNEGSVNLLLGNTLSWLAFNWGVDCDGDTVNDSGACGTASFGLYRGDDRIIYWREVFQ